MTSKLLLSLISTAPLPVAVLFANVNTPGGSPTALSDSSLIAASLCPLILVPSNPGALHCREQWSSYLSLDPDNKAHTPPALWRPRHGGASIRCSPSRLGIVASADPTGQVAHAVAWMSNDSSSQDLQTFLHQLVLASNCLDFDCRLIFTPAACAW